MRILIVTAGSRGDVAPFTGLGRRLKQAGHDVALAAHATFADLVNQSDLELRVLPGDPVALTLARTAEPDPAAARSVFADYLDQLGDGIVDVTTAGADLVITAFGPAPLCRTVAEALGIRSIGAYLVPGYPTAAFPPPGLADSENLGPERNLAAGREMFGRATSMYDEVIARVRTRLDACPTTMGGASGDWPIFHGFSTAVVPRPADWPPFVRVSGYWWPAPSAGWQPAQELVDFLADGPVPVFVGFGSMTASEGESLADTVVAAVHRAKVRAVVQAGWSGIAPTGADICAVGDVPHDWLFPRTAAVVHHAGAGTTAAGLRAGVPAVTVPVLVDQPFWAARLHQLGAAPPPIPRRELTADRLADALRMCIDVPGYRERAARLAEQLRSEDGCMDVLEYVGRLEC